LIAKGPEAVSRKHAEQAEGEKVDFESALSRLESIVHDLEEGQIGLGESLARYEQGVKLLRQCYEMLEGAQRRIELLTGVDAEGRPISQPLDDDERSLEEKADRRSRAEDARIGRNSTRGKAARSEDDVDDAQKMT
jgi:exodeoxyribonuclease VII small subunit